LHLLIVDAEKEPASEVVKRVFSALQATPASGERFQRPGFSDGGRIYGPLLADEVTPERVYPLLLTMRRNLRLRAAAGFVNDVALVYFRSSEAITKQGHFFLTSDSARDPELRWSGIPCDYLSKFFGGNLGAQLVLFDVTRPAAGNGQELSADQVSHWPEDPHVAVWRYSWSGNAPAQQEDARLLTDVRTAMAKASTLGEVAKQVGENFVDTAKIPRESRKYRQLTLNQQLPPGMEDLMLGKRGP
jgi:hypothetical protein